MVQVLFLTKMLGKWTQKWEQLVQVLFPTKMYVKWTQKCEEIVQVLFLTFLALISFTLAYAFYPLLLIYRSKARFLSIR